MNQRVNRFADQQTDWSTGNRCPNVWLKHTPEVPPGFHRWKVLSRLSPRSLCLYTFTLKSKMTAHLCSLRFLSILFDSFRSDCWFTRRAVLESVTSSFKVFNYASECKTSVPQYLRTSAPQRLGATVPVHTSKYHTCARTDILLFSQSHFNDVNHVFNVFCSLMLAMKCLMRLQQMEDLS